MRSDRMVETFDSGQNRFEAFSAAALANPGNEDLSLKAQALRHEEESR
jgi:hypothetical protein